MNRDGIVLEDISIQMLPAAEVTSTAPRPQVPFDHVQPLEYVEHIIELGRTDEKFKRLAGFLQNYRTRQIDPDLSSVNAIVDFTETNSQSRMFKNPLSRSFSEALRNLQSDVRTRVIILKDSKRAIFATAATIDALGTTYNIDPAFFASMAQLSDLRESSEKHTITDYVPWERPLYPSFIELGYNTIPDKSEGPRIWVTVQKNFVFRDSIANIVIIRFTPSHLDRGDMTEEPLDYYPQLLPLALPPIDKSSNNQLGYCIWNLKEFTTQQIRSANNDPIAYIFPFISLFQAYFSRNMHQLRRTHWEWLHHELGGPSITQAERDNQIFAIWNTARSILEDFSMLTDQLQDYATGMSPPRSKNNAVTTALLKHKSMLIQARKLEFHVRDTIQLNVSSLSLRESRRSIEQADSVGRITFLAFVFLPLSLITSFFGMNIQELTGTGFTWKVFGGATAVLCALTGMVCLWMWRGRFAWFTWLLYAPVMAPLAATQLIWMMGTEFVTDSVQEVWSGPVGNLVLEWWSLGPFGKRQGK